MDSELVVQFALKDLHPFISCTLCDGYFRNAHTIPECMHTFCKICIQRHFFQNANGGPITCPNCHIQLGPYKSSGSKIIFDRNIQSIVDKLFPHFNEQIKKRKEQFKPAAKNAKKRKAGEEITFQVVPYPRASASESLPELKKQGVKVKSTSKIAVIQKFIFKRFDEELQKSFHDEYKDIELIYNDQKIDWEDFQSLDSHADDSPVVLHYRRAASSSATWERVDKPMVRLLTCRVFNASLHVPLHFLCN